MRKTGILMHISSLPSKYGIGTFGESAYTFIDKLNEAKQSYWQILPLGPTSYGDSPYQTFSAFAINPYFIDLDFLIKDNLLKKEDIIDSTYKSNQIDYKKIYDERFLVLRKAFNNFDLKNNDYLSFVSKHEKWLNDYALFMAIKKKFNDKSIDYWDNDLRNYKPTAINKAKLELKDEINFYLFLQFEAYRQWDNLKKYANSKNIKIIGDLPIYIAYDSSDLWANPKIFKLDKENIPTHVAGVPPDNFSKDGQLWGNPIYDWKYLEETNYNWWVRRLRSTFELFDVVRIDHFIGFVHYYQIPFGDLTAKNGKWVDGPSYKLFETLKKELGTLDIIAEDLGLITDGVRDLLKKTGYPGMKLLQFAFDSNEDNNYLPHYYDKNTVAYTGTHDNPTSKEYFKLLNKNDLKYALNYMNHRFGNKVLSLIKETLKSPSYIAIIPIQDYLFLGKNARINTPSTLGNNWTWRLKPNQFNQKTINLIKELTTIYGRANT